MNLYILLLIYLNFKCMIERNDLCWCGSGKKFKKCHLQFDPKYQKNPLPSESHSMIKNQEERDGMRKAGKFNGQLMDYIRPYVQPGISTEDINILVHDYTINHGYIPACLGYNNFPKSVCTSINEVVCHGIPSTEEILKSGDIINVDLTTIVDGYYADSSETFMVGMVTEQIQKLVWTTAEALLRSINALAPGKHLSTIAESIEPYVISKGFSVVRQYTGHGIGKKFHEYFSVCHHRTSQCENLILEPGMTFTIEPMVNSGQYHVVVDRKDGWTVRTKDNSMSAQFEHTILITDDGFEVLTLCPSQIAKGTILNLQSGNGIQ